MKKIISLKLGVLVDLKRSKRLFFFEPAYISDLLQDSSDESAADVVAVAAIAADVVAVADNAADVVAVADNAADVVADVVAVADNAADIDENTGDDASDLEPEPTVPKASTTKKVAVPKTSKKRGPRGPYKKTQTIVSLLN